MRSPQKRITSKTLIELRRDMIEHPEKSDVFTGILLDEILSLRAQCHSSRFSKEFARLRTDVANRDGKIALLKVQMYKMIKGYEKKIKKLEEMTPVL